MNCCKCQSIQISKIYPPSQFCVLITSIIHKTDLIIEGLLLDAQILLKTIVMVPYIKNNAWVTVNNDFFWSWVRRFANDFHEWWSHKWKSSVNHITSDPKIVIHGNECIILFITRNLMSLTHNCFKNNHRWFISQLLSRTVFSDLALWQLICDVTRTGYTSVVTSYSWLFLHAQIDVKAIFTSE